MVYAPTFSQVLFHTPFSSVCYVLMSMPAIAWPHLPYPVITEVTEGKMSNKSKMAPPLTFSWVPGSLLVLFCRRALLSPITAFPQLLSSAFSLPWSCHSLALPAVFVHQFPSPPSPGALHSVLWSIPSQALSDAEWPLASAQVSSA